MTIIFIVILVKTITIQQSYIMLYMCILCRIKHRYNDTVKNCRITYVVRTYTQYSQVKNEINYFNNYYSITKVCKNKRNF